MNLIKTQDQIVGIRQSSQLAARCLQFLGELVRPGISTQYLDEAAVSFIRDNNATSATLGYKGYPKSICTSVNNVVCHGIPSAKVVLREGDIINIDVTTILNGYYGDTSATFPVGHINSQNKKLIEVTKDAMYRSIASLAPGKFINDCIGKVIEPFVEKNGFSVVKELGGHGVGLSFHEDLFIYHHDNPVHDVQLQPGMTFTIEPMVNASKDYRVTLDRRDGWTIYTADGSASAQFEHTVVITPKGAEILTKI